MWQHNYEPIAGSLGLSAAVAALPIVVLFIMLGVLRKPAWMSAVAALASAMVVALAVYGMPVGLAVISTIYGAAYGVFPAGEPAHRRRTRRAGAERLGAGVGGGGRRRHRRTLARRHFSAQT